MKPKILLFVGLLITIFSCSNNDDNNSQPNINGKYIGIFEREGNVSKVVLNFKNGSFFGESETEKFPAICKGSYSISNNSIMFNNECPWTAEFDWSLILNEEWKYGIDNHTFTLIRPNGDKYTLTKQ